MNEISENLPQLEMVWPAGERDRPPLKIAPGYELRIYRNDEDDQTYLSLMLSAGFDTWTEDRLIVCYMTALPNGWFLVVDTRTQAVVATAMATHRPAPYHPYGGELGWVAAHPEHRGRGLGWTVTAAVTGRLIEAGYESIYLKTDDFRLPAIRTYLRIGYVPFLYTAGMAARWHSICTQLEWPFTPDEWPSAETIADWRQQKRTSANRSAENPGASSSRSADKNEERTQ
jgi:mycothiol synthase